MEDLQDRIYTVVEEALPLSSTGLNVLGFDVVFGNWDVNGKLTAAYAIVIVARASLPGGAALLDGGPADVQIQIIGQVTAEGPAGDFYPSDKAIRSHVTTACDVMRQKTTQRQAPSNGGIATPNPFTEALKRYQGGHEGK
jgi:hypothetical protein